MIEEDIMSHTMSKTNTNEKNACDSLIQNKKLCLVLDLDNTLIHTTLDPVAVDRFLSHNPGSSSNFDNNTNVIDVEGDLILVRTRPYVHYLLHSLSKRYEFSIFTMGTRAYAKAITSLLEAKQKHFYPTETPEIPLFKHVATREDFPDSHTKTLEPYHNLMRRMVVVVDDRRDVWRNELSNLIQVRPYEHFHYSYSEVNSLDCSCSCCPDSSYNSDVKCCGAVVNDDNDDALLSLEETLDSIHRRFYDPFEKTDNDIRKLLKKRVLEGVHLVFSGLISRSSDPSTSFLWRIAEEHGAECYDEVGPHITHVVAANDKTSKVKRAQEMFSVNIVNRLWLEDSVESLLRKDENDYCLNSSANRASNFCEDSSPCVLNICSFYELEKDIWSKKRRRLNDDSEMDHIYFIHHQEVA
ncbi:hypothetical protein AKO1_005765 [Acrasis kona]|uniref:protein-serine/threonine phosphatase n=1 Tax=Acrasis kona TaxID=1008807 RepID=A0AAW2YJ25_9EUKA